MVIQMQPQNFTLILFDLGQAVSIVKHDDYTQYIDIKSETAGSTLADVNYKDYSFEEIVYDLKDYLEQMRDSYTIVHTNHPELCRNWLWRNGINGFGTRLLDIPSRIVYTREYIKEKAQSLYDFEMEGQ